jgi:hypothetical protein
MTQIMLTKTIEPQCERGYLVFVALKKYEVIRSP